MKISVIGSGFAALTALTELRKQLPKAEITMISPTAELVYLPSLIWLPSGLRKPEDLRVDLGPFLQKHRIHHYCAAVTGLSADGRVVHTDNGDVQNEALIIASGGRFIKKLPGIEHAITLCEGVDAGMAIADKLAQLEGGRIALGFASNPNEPSAMRGGPMFELLFGLDTLLRRQKRRDKFTLTFFNPAPRPGQRLGEKAVDGLLAEMHKRGIHTHLGHKPKAFTANIVITEGGEIDADVILFMPGMTGPAWLENTRLPKSAGGMIVADAHCQVAGFERVYVAGDSGSYPAPDWAPKQAHMADIQAKTAARNLVAHIQGRPARDKIHWELVCIVDTLNQGILVFRNEKRAFILPPLHLMHWAKRVFEKIYLGKYRQG